METKIEDVIKKYTNEDGAVDYSQVDKELADIKQLEIDKVAKKKDEKAKRKIAEIEAKYNEQINETSQQAENQTEELVKSLQSQINDMKTQSEREKSVNSFVARAKKENVPDEVIRTLTKSVNNLDEFDLTPFKGEEVKQITPINHLDKEKETTSSKEQTPTSKQIEDFRFWKSKRK